MSAKLFDAKDYEEVVTLTFKFVDGLNPGETIQAPITCAIAMLSGVVDANPGAVISGAPQLSGTNVLQQVGPSVPGANYYLRARAATNTGRTLVVGGVLPSIKDGLA